MKKMLMVLIGFSVLITGCGYVENKKYSGKVFDVKVGYMVGDKTKVEIWENANKLSYDKEEGSHTFYVDGKLVELDSGVAVILTEVGAPKPMSVKAEKYVGKKFDITVLHGREIIRKWENVELESAESGNVQFVVDGVVRHLMTSINDTTIIEEVRED